jgi:hypothetical protein
VTTISNLACGLLLLVAVGNDLGAGKAGELPSGNNTVAGPALLEGSAGSKSIIFSNFSGENHHYGITIVNQGKLSVTVKDFGQLGGSNFSATVEPNSSFGAHVSLNNTSSIQVVFDKPAEKSDAQGLSGAWTLPPRKSSGSHTRRYRKAAHYMAIGYFLAAPTPRVTTIPISVACRDRGGP